MNAEQNQAMEPRAITGGDDGNPKFDSDFRFGVTVLATTPVKTISALRAARNLARGLELRLTLLAIEEVPFRIPLERPLVSLEFTERQLHMLVAKSGVEPEDVSVQICLCRERDLGLRHTLRPHSLVVLGASKNWWSFGEQRLGRTLQEMGHIVVIATDFPQEPGADEFSKVLRGNASRVAGDRS